MIDTLMFDSQAVSMGCRSAIRSASTQYDITAMLHRAAYIRKHTGTYYSNQDHPVSYQSAERSGCGEHSLSCPGTLGRVPSLVSVCDPVYSIISSAQRRYTIVSPATVLNTVGTSPVDVLSGGILCDACVIITTGNAASVVLYNHP